MSEYWSRGEKIAAASLLVAVITLLVSVISPELRRAAGLSEVETSDTSADPSGSPTGALRDRGADADLKKAAAKPEAEHSVKRNAAAAASLSMHQTVNEMIRHSTTTAETTASLGTLHEAKLLEPTMAARPTDKPPRLREQGESVATTSIATAPTQQERPPEPRPTTSAVDPSFIGLWDGIVFQKGAAPYRVRFSLIRGNLDEKVGEIEYPTFGCSGALRLLEAGPQEIKVAEDLQVGTTKCVPGGTITVTLDTSSKSSWFWSDGNPRNDAKAVVTKY